MKYKILIFDWIFFAADIWFECRIIVMNVGTNTTMRDNRKRKFMRKLIGETFILNTFSISAKPESNSVNEPPELSLIQTLLLVPRKQ